MASDTTMSDTTMYSTVFTDLNMRFEWLIDLFNETLHNYERPVKRGFFCSDTSIRYPYFSDDTISIFTLLCIITVPLLFMIWHQSISWMLAYRRSDVDSILQRPHPMGVVGGALLTTLLTVCMKLGIGRLAPNFYEGCMPKSDCYNSGYWSEVLSHMYITDFTCFHPERLREVSRSFPCVYTSLSSFSWFYFLIYLVYNSPTPSLRRTFAVITCLAIPACVAFTRLHDNRSHSGDVIAGCILGISIAVILTVGRKAKSDWTEDDKDVDFEMLSMRESEEASKEKNLRPTVRVCSSALTSNIQGFIDELKHRLNDYVVGIDHVILPYSDLDSFKPTGWNKTDVVILCHSINNRRLSITDVTDALYNEFLKMVTKHCGKDSVIVIAHDFEWKEDQLPKAREDIEATLRIKQPTTFKCAGTVILAGKLDKWKASTCLSDVDWKNIEAVIPK
ncbi:phospholipid phosphatase homolog 1.2 homolog [Lytechinus pictus]|uniref:phospholipid phosphatase homolog 1.2 homolog n=1 Tax=Lytechinus pictus TaxID=7653 RepID=UPI0030B9B945